MSLRKLFNRIKNLSLDEFYYILQYGIPVRKGAVYSLREADFKNLKDPVFFLSTGRCGTTWFSKLLASNKKLKILHSPTPSLGVQGRKFFDIFTKSKEKISDNEKLLAREIFISAREQHLRYCYKTDRRYIETNNHVTFFAPILADLFPGAKFVHLYRHPGEFIRSGMRRKYYSEDDYIVAKRIVPVSHSDKYYSYWNNYSQMEKIAWLWYETNNFIERFKNNIAPERIFNFNFNYINDKTKLQELFSDIEIKMNNKQINKMIGNKINKQKKGDIQSYSQWSEGDKDKIKQICGKLAHKYGYNLN